MFLAITIKNSSCWFFLGVVRVSRLPVKFLQMRKVVPLFSRFMRKQEAAPFVVSYTRDTTLIPLQCLCQHPKPGVIPTLFWFALLNMWEFRQNFQQEARSKCSKAAVNRGLNMPLPGVVGRKAISAGYVGRTVLTWPLGTAHCCSGWSFVQSSWYYIKYEQVGEE